MVTWPSGYLRGHSVARLGRLTSLRWDAFTKTCFVLIVSKIDTERVIYFLVSARDELKSAYERLIYPYLIFFVLQVDRRADGNTYDSMTQKTVDLVRATRIGRLYSPTRGRLKNVLRRSPPR